MWLVSELQTRMAPSDVVIESHWWIVKSVRSWRNVVRWKWCEGKLRLSWNGLTAFEAQEIDPQFSLSTNRSIYPNLNTTNDVSWLCPFKVLVHQFILFYSNYTVSQNSNKILYAWILSSSIIQEVYVTIIGYTSSIQQKKSCKIANEMHSMCNRDLFNRQRARRYAVRALARNIRG